MKALVPPVNGQLLLLGKQFSLVATSAPAKSSGLFGCPKKSPAGDRWMEPVHEAALGNHGLGARLKICCCGRVIAASNSERLLGLVA